MRLGWNENDSLNCHCGFCKAAALLVCLARDLHIFQEMRQLLQTERLRAVDQRLERLRMEIDQNQVGPRDHPLRRCVEEIEQSVGRAVAAADRVGGGRFRPASG